MSEKAFTGSLFAAHEQKRRYRQYVERAILCILIGLIWGVLTLPTVFYHLPTDEETSSIGPGSLSTCSGEVYNGSICRRELQSLQNCIPDRCGSTQVYITSNTNQSEIEKHVARLMGGLRLLNPSSDCRAVIGSFLCSYYFGLCSGDGKPYLPSSGQCETVATETCSSEFERAIALLGRNGLPQCEKLSAVTTFEFGCTGECSGVSELENELETATPETITPSASTTDNDASVSPESTCSAEIYTGDVCRSALQSLQSCIPDRCGSTEVYIPSTGLQNEIEQQLATLVGGLQLVNPSPECQAAIVPFLCSYYFQLCDSSNTLHPPSLQDCVLIANQTCAREFQTAVTVLGRDNLPNCETLPTTTALQLECDGQCNDQSTEMVATEPSNDECSAEVYVGTICRASLQSLQNCIPDRCGSTEVYIPSTGLQNEIEQRLASLVGGLQLVNPSPECQAAIVPFLCSYYFRLCDSSNTLHPPSLQDCVQIANQTCAREFQTAVTVLGRENLPNCETLPTTTALQLECDGQCNDQSTEMVATEPSVDSNDECSAEVYVGTICRASLQSLQNCIPDRCDTTDVYIPSTGNQSDIEDQLTRLLGGLQLLNPSQECLAAVVPFMCSYYFSLCDSTGRLHQPSSSECAVIATETCAAEFQKAIQILGRETLPRCDVLPPIGLDCQNSEKCDTEASTATATVASNDDASSSIPSDDTNAPSLQCRKGFYLEMSNDSSDELCTAECGKWEEFPHHVVVTGDAIVIVQAVVYIIAAAVLLVLSGIHHKRMLKFPAIFVIYGMFPLGLFELFILIGFMDRTALFCSSKSLQNSLRNPTAFCHIQGGVSHFVFLQQILMWFFHIIAVFWTIKFPFHAKSFETKGYTRYVHYGMLALTFILPFITIIVIAGTGGCRASRIPAIICLARKPDVTFYAFVLPLSILTAAGMSLIVVMFWILYHITRDLADIKNKKQEPKLEKGSLKRTFTSLKHHTTINAAEMKILIIFVYFSIFLGSTLITLTIRLHGFNDLISGITTHFSCESAGVEAEECSRSFERVESEVSTIITYALIGFFPIVNLIYVINFQELKQRFSWLFKRMARKEITSTTSGTFRARGTSTSTSTGV